MKVKHLFETPEYTRSDAKNDEIKGVVDQELFDHFNKNFSYLYQDVDYNTEHWNDEQVDKLDGEDLYLPAKQYLLLTRYIDRVTKQGGPNERTKAKLTEFINRNATTFYKWQETPEGTSVRDDIEYDIADREAYKGDKYKYYGVSRKDFY